MNEVIADQPIACINRLYFYSTVFSMLLLIVLFHSCKNNKNILSVGEAPQDFSIMKTDSAEYNVELIKDKFYSFKIDQKGIDVVVYLVNSKNEIVVEKDSPYGSNGPEQFYYFCESQDEYKLQIKPFNEDVNPAEGKYSIEISEVSTETNIVLEKSEYLEDFQIFRAIYEEANSGLYRYHSKQEVDSVFALSKLKINDEISYREFYGLIWDVIDFTGSCHNNLFYPKSLNIPLRRKKVFFPLPLKHINDKLFSNLDYKDIPAGREIISINGLSAEKFVTTVSKFRSSDGFNKTSKYAFINTSAVSTYIFYALGEKDEFIIKYRHNNEVKSTSLKSVTHDTFLQNYKRRPSKELEERITDQYHYDFIDSLSVGILTTKSFNVGDKGNDTYIQFASFLDNVFKDLDYQTDLIVDVRGNGGGSGDALMLLTSYLTDRKFKENIQAYTLFNKVPYPEHYNGSIEDTETFLSEHYINFKNGKYFQNEKYNSYWQPNDNAYQKSFVLLIDPFVASAASHFAAHIKSDKSAVVIGEETGGGYYGHTGHFPVSYELPNSKLNLFFSIVNLEQDVVKLSDEKEGTGIMPDIKVVQTHPDFMENIDTQLNAAIDYLQSKISK